MQEGIWGGGAFPNVSLCPTPCPTLCNERIFQKAPHRTSLVRTGSLPSFTGAKRDECTVFGLGPSSLSTMLPQHLHKIGILLWGWGGGRQPLQVIKYPKVPAREPRSKQPRGPPGRAGARLGVGALFCVCFPSGHLALTLPGGSGSAALPPCRILTASASAFSWLQGPHHAQPRWLWVSKIPFPRLTVRRAPLIMSQPGAWGPWGLGSPLCPLGKSEGAWYRGGARSAAPSAGDCTRQPLSEGDRTREAQS